MQEFFHHKGFEFGNEQSAFPNHDIEREAETRPASTGPATEGRWRNNLNKASGGGNTVMLLALDDARLSRCHPRSMPVCSEEVTGELTSEASYERKKR